MNNTPNQKTGAVAENPTVAANQNNGALSGAMQEVADATVQYLEIGTSAETANKVFDAISATSGGGGTGDAAARKQKKQQILREKVARVQTLPKATLVRDIDRSMHQEIHHLEKEAKKVQRSLHRFDAGRLNEIVAKIRRLREQLAELIHLSIEKLRDLYIQFVLKLQVITVG